MNNNYFISVVKNNNFTYVLFNFLCSSSFVYPAMHFYSQSFLSSTLLTIFTEHYFFLERSHKQTRRFRFINHLYSRWVKELWLTLFKSLFFRSKICYFTIRKFSFHTSTKFSFYIFRLRFIDSSSGNRLYSALEARGRGLDQYESLAWFNSVPSLMYFSQNINQPH